MVEQLDDAADLFVRQNHIGLQEFRDMGPNLGRKLVSGELGINISSHHVPCAQHMTRDEFVELCYTPCSD